VFAGERISKNTRIIDYAGELILNSRSTAREARYLKQGRIWVFRVNRRWSRDAAVGGNIARLINHSCRPNCWWEVVGTTIWIRASRTIEPGEELTYDYATVGDKTIQCRCRLPRICIPACHPTDASWQWRSKVPITISTSTTSTVR